MSIDKMDSTYKKAYQREVNYCSRYEVVGQDEIEVRYEVREEIH